MQSPVLRLVTLPGSAPSYPILYAWAPTLKESALSCHGQLLAIPSHSCRYATPRANQNCLRSSDLRLLQSHRRREDQRFQQRCPFVRHERAFHRHSLRQSSRLAAVSGSPELHQMWTECACSSGRARRAENRASGGWEEWAASRRQNPEVREAKLTTPVSFDRRAGP